MSNLTSMAFGDIRLVTFFWANWLLPSDVLIGTPVVTFKEPIISASLVSANANATTCVMQAGNFAGTGELTVSVTTAAGEKATRTAYVPVVPLLS